MRRLLMGALFVLLMNSGCTIAHTYGPYMGKVVDKGTGEPIEGAVAYIHFTSGSPFENTSWNGGWEMLTDANGEFLFPRDTIWRYRFLETWDLDPRMIVFKPGFGSYPGRGSELVRKSDKHWAGYPEDEKVLIMLPRLTTIEERKDNIYSIQPKPPSEMKLFYKTLNNEMKNVGLQPYQTGK